MDWVPVLAHVHFNMAALLRLGAAKAYRSLALLSVRNTLSSLRNTQFPQSDISRFLQPSVFAARSFTDNTTPTFENSGSETDQAAGELKSDWQKEDRGGDRNIGVRNGDARFNRIANKLGTITAKHTLLSAFNELVRRGEWIGLSAHFQEIPYYYERNQFSFYLT